ncbi:hypothetical protein SOVF_029560 [Spinacia oleracea]|nr:hypothetical protein SOVF_029560 [Spinacia oleracea]
MATEASGGAGGKFRKKPVRKSQATPYDRPPTALRPTQLVGGGGEREKNSWLSKLVDPASRLITAGAHKIFSSVFRKRLLPPPPPPQHSPGERTEIRDVQPEITTKVGSSGTKEPLVYKGNDSGGVSESSGVADLEYILKQKTFTRSEIDHLSALLLSRTVDNLAGDEKGRSELDTSDKKVAHSRREILTNLPAIENGGERVLPAVISTPVVRSKVVEDVVASPAELAKAYMGSRPTKASSSVLGPKSDMAREDLSAPYNPFFKQKSPAVSVIQRPTSEIGASANGYMTPRYRGRSAIYSMGRTPYSRHHPTDIFKSAEMAFDTHGASSSSSSHNTTETQQLSGSKKQVLKRRSSALESDIGFVGPIRRIRQKPNLLHHKILSLPASGVPHIKHGYGALTEATEVPSSIDWSSNHRSSSKALAENGVHSTSNGYVPSQSIETAQKIFQHLDKFSSKGKSPEKKCEIMGGSSAAKMTTDMREGLAHKSMSTESLKVLQTIQDSRKENGLMDSSNAHDHSLKTSPRVEGGTTQRIVIPSVEDGAEAGSSKKALEYMNHRSSFDQQQKKRSFQMSAHEDYLELDDDVHTNGVASAPMIKGVECNKLAESSAAFSDNPQSAAVSAVKPIAPEIKPSLNSLGSNKEESLPDGSAAQAFSGFTIPTGLLTSSTTSTSKQAAVSSQFTAEINKFSSNSAEVVPISFYPSSSVVESTAAKDIKPELSISSTEAANKADELDKTAKGNTLHFGDVSKKMEGSVSSSGKSLFSFETQPNGATLTNVPSTVSVSRVTSSPVPISSSSNDQRLAPVSVSSSPSLSISNGNAVSTLSDTSAGTVINTATTGGMPIFGSNTSQFSTSIAPAVPFGSNLQFGSPSVPFTPAAATSASESVVNSGAKLSDSAFCNATSGQFSAKPTETASVGNNIFGFSASTLKSTSSETPPVLQAAIFSSQASSSAVASTTSIAGLSSQSAPSASSHVFGFSAPSSAYLSTGANPFTTGSGSASSVFGLSSVTAPVSSSSNTTSNIFGLQSSKPAVTGSTFGASGFQFGLKASEASATSNSTPIVFGATSSSSAAKNSTPLVFGAASSSSAANSASFTFGATSSAANSAPFAFGAVSSASAFSVPSAAASAPVSNTLFSSQPALFGGSTPSPFGFGSTPPVGNNDRIGMEDSMAEDSVQVPTPAAPVFGQAISASPSSFVFNGAAPSAGSPFQFAGQQNQFAAQNTPFQPSASLEFNAGGAGSFSVGSGGGDKANRRIVKVKKGIRRK